jgi:hypothetical protein
MRLSFCVPSAICQNLLNRYRQALRPRALSIDVASPAASRGAPRRASNLESPYHQSRRTLDMPDS